MPFAPFFLSAALAAAAFQSLSSERWRCIFLGLHVLVVVVLCCRGFLDWTKTGAASAGFFIDFQLLALAERKRGEEGVERFEIEFRKVWSDEFTVENG